RRRSHGRAPSPLCRRRRAKRKVWRCAANIAWPLCAPGRSGAASFCSVRPGWHKPASALASYPALRLRCGAPASEACLGWESDKTSGACPCRRRSAPTHAKQSDHGGESRRRATRPAPRSAALFVWFRLAALVTDRSHVVSGVRTCDSADLLRLGPLNFDALQTTAQARSDFNSGQRHIQTIGQKAPQSLISTTLHRRNIQANAESALPFAIDLIAACARLHANEKTQSTLALTDCDHRLCRAPKRAVPMRICVAPSSMANSKSRDIPMDN